MDVTRGGKRQGVSNKIEVGTASVSLVGDLDVDASAALRPNTPVRIAARDGLPGLSIYTLPSPAISDSGWVRSFTSGVTPVAALQSRPAVGDVPAGNRQTYGFTVGSSGNNLFQQTLMYRMVWGGNFQPGRRYRVTARAIDHVAGNNAAIRLVATNYAVSGHNLEVLGRGRLKNSNAYTPVPAIEFVMPAELTGSYLNIGFGMVESLPWQGGSSGTFMGISLAEFKIEMLPQEPSAVFTGRLADLTQRNELDKDTGDVRTFTTVLVTDAVSIHANTPRYGAVTENGSGFEVWENRINRLAASAQAPVYVPKEQAERGIYTANGYQAWTALSASLAPNNPAAWTTLLPSRETWPEKQCWYVEYSKTGSSATYPIGTLGIQRTFTGLTKGSTYRVEAHASRASYSQVTAMRIGVAGLGAAASTPVAADPASTRLTAYQFTATGTSHTVQVTNSTAVTLAPGTTGYADMAVIGVKITQTGVPSPYRLQDIVFESDLASHFDLASNSVGGRWWVDQQGVTQFRQGTEPEPLKGTWIDRPALTPGTFEYVDVQTAYDTRSLVTALELAQKGRKVDEEGKDSADDVSTVFLDEPAVKRWGVRSDTLTTSLYSGQGFEQSPLRRAQGVFTDYSNSQRTITGFRWNAQEDIRQALALDIYDAVRVERGELPVTGRIIGLKHSITPTRWMIDVALTDVRAGVTYDELNAAIGTRTYAQLNTLLGNRTWAELNADPLNGLTS
ncbi:hypothetical protein IFU30_10955 [Plantibacter sp. CFBP 8798]|uniref:hypothetical protein n=1 Tax=Plantibacter sp. CFBP 8798 TaxID=2775268 RepID=UPI0017824489|nr:hypothetical protein [Plantibacter sp. CFBP 8798]MBD8466786.1 hypothetical protein [Plantibacter sp. CFBP 8798]